MRIAVTARAGEPGSPVDPRFGRAAHFMVFDTGDRSWHPVTNAQSLQLAQGAGIQAAQHVSQADAQVLLTGHCGPKAFRALQAAGIAVVTGVEGTVADAVAAYERGELQPAAAADKDGHW